MPESKHRNRLSAVFREVRLSLAELSPTDSDSSETAQQSEEGQIRQFKERNTSINFNLILSPNFNRCTLGLHQQFYGCDLQTSKTSESSPVAIETLTTKLHLIGRPQETLKRILSHKPLTKADVK